MKKTIKTIASIYTFIFFITACGSEEQKISHALNSSPHSNEKNINFGNLKVCGLSPMTGFYRNGSCYSGEEDIGVHTVCAIMTSEFLLFSLENGNDLVSPNTSGTFPGLKPGDKWCICADWWKAAEGNDLAPLVDMEATHAKTLLIVEKSKILPFALE